MKILSIDPGYERLGIAILEKISKGKSSSAKGYGGTREILLYSECFKTSSKLPHHERLALIGNKVKEIIKKISLQGGSINPEHYYLYQDNKIEYLCYTNQYYQK